VQWQDLGFVQTPLARFQENINNAISPPFKSESKTVTTRMVGNTIKWLTWQV